ncbi:tRNA pseudouridine(55) synthase TruB [Clostridium thermarum]|uniref:tRNA pseudouridine(55) synthase TruB n=1 Tax=Clostridium thermarum TaxID=1716543 RepID=UPI001120AECD|nr:tRNA pseudouridine(55) synthase TruB [Clostridium thermarum]
MDGIINCYKPDGITSFDAVNKIKKIVKGTKVGHTGTLDPAASGVLPICIGKATKLIDYIMEGTKGYAVEMTLGIVTDTYDREGKIISRNEVNVSPEEIQEAILSFQGNIKQVPPMYSALKQNGKRLYELAREGIEVERPARSVNIEKIDILSINENKVKFHVECSKGTYIRSLCFDIGEKLGCGAMMSGLERTFSGNFKIENSVNVNNLNIENINQYIIPMDEALVNFREIRVDGYFGKLLSNGVEIRDFNFLKGIEIGEYKVYNSDCQLIGIGHRYDKSFKISTLLI